MAQSGAIKGPAQIASAHRLPINGGLCRDVKERGAGRGHDLDAAIVLHRVAVDMTGRDSKNTARRTAIQQLAVRYGQNTVCCQRGLVGVFAKRRHMGEHHDGATVSVRQRGLKKRRLSGLVRVL